MKDQTGKEFKILGCVLLAFIVTLTAMNAKADEKIAGRNDRSNAIVQIVNAVKDGRMLAKVAANPSEVTTLQIQVAIRQADNHHGNVSVKKKGVGLYEAKWVYKGSILKRLTISLEGRGH